MPENYHADCDDADELIDGQRRELERLREALKRIASFKPGTHWLGFRCQDIARAALEEP